MYQCNIVKSPVVPLFFKIAKLRNSRQMMSSCFSELEFRPKSTGNGRSPQFRRFSRRLGSHESTQVMPTRAFTSSAQQRNDAVGEERRRTGVALPWLVAARGHRHGKRAQERAPVGTKRSSWEEAADKFLSRSETAVVPKGAVVAEEEEKEEEEEREVGEIEPIDDPRWDKIRNRFSGFVGHERQFEKRKIQRWNKHESLDRNPGKEAEESRFEKPEVRRWIKQENWGRKTWKETTESSVPKMVGQGVYGVGPVLAALMAGRREFYALYVQEGLDLSGNSKKKKDKKAVEKIMKITERVGLKVVEASKHDLNMIVDNRPHQGLILDASPLEMVDIKELDPVVPEGGKAPLWLALDEVTDPQNLGAIIRSAYFFGAEGVVLCSKNSAPLSGVVSKASAGSLELVELLSCKNMMQFLSSSAENGWRVLGGSVSSRAVPLNEVEAGAPTILVLGSEGSGLRPLVERSCTQLIRIPGSAPANACDQTPEVDIEEKDRDCFGQDINFFLAVESLNVSVAAGVLLYQLIGKNNRAFSEKPNEALI